MKTLPAVDRAAVAVIDLGRGPGYRRFTGAHLVLPPAGER
jgi:hypothetical protein